MEILKNDFLHANDEIAINIYKNCEDMDAADYDETRENDIKEIKSALEWLEAAAQNEYNKSSFKTLYLALQHIFTN